MPQQQQSPLLQYGPKENEHGPFMNMLTEQATAPQQQNNGWTGALGGTADLAGKFLQGVSRGRLMKYQREEGEREKSHNVYQQWVATKYDDPDLTAAGKQKLAEAFQKRLLSEAHSAVSDGTKGSKGKGKDGGPGSHILGAMKSVLEGLSGGKMPERGEKIDPTVEAANLMKEFSDPRYSVKAQSQKLFQGFNTAYQEAVADLRSQNIVPDQNNIASHPKIAAALNEYTLQQIPRPDAVNGILAGQYTPDQAFIQQGTREIPGQSAPQPGAPPAQAAPAPGATPAQAPPGGAPPAARPMVTPAAASIAPNAPPAPPTSESGQRPLFGAPANLSFAAQAALHKLTGATANAPQMYLTDKDNKLVATVEQYMPGRFREVGTNAELDARAQAERGLSIRKDKPPEHADHWTKAGNTPPDAKGETHVLLVNSLNGKTMVPSAAVVQANGGIEAIQKLMNTAEREYRNHVTTFKSQETAELARIAANPAIPPSEKHVAAQAVRKLYGYLEADAQALHENYQKLIMGQRPKAPDPEVRGAIADAFHNPGNLMDGQGNRQHFETDDEGWQALRGDVTAKLTGKSVHSVPSTGELLGPKSTLREFFEVYAPKAAGNDPDNYARTVADWMGIKPDAKIGGLRDRLEDIVQGIGRMENSASWKNGQGRKKTDAPPAARAASAAGAPKGKSIDTAALLGLEQ